MTILQHLMYAANIFLDAFQRFLSA